VLGISGVAGAQDDEGEIELLKVSSRAFTFDKIGSFTTFHCADAAQAPACSLFERLDVQPVLDWDRLVDKARRLAPKTKFRAEVSTAPIAVEFAVDRFGGPWRVALRGGGGKNVPEFLQPFAYEISPAFPGYKVTLKENKVAGAEVLRDRSQWDAACKELGLDENGKKKKKKGLW